MSETFLDMIVAKRRHEVSILRAAGGVDALIDAAERVRSTAEKHRLHASLSRSDRTNVIAEIKRASPSRGVINDEINVAQRAHEYAAGGAAAISVLTEPEYFKGSLDDLRTVRATVDIPILRKDFFVDEFQIYEAAGAGADAVLLIVAALSTDELKRLRSLAEDEMGLDAVVEVHARIEIERAVKAGAKLIGVNNRDLHSLAVSLDVSRDLIRHKPDNVLMIAESGISTRDQIDELRSLGFDGFLVGESLMRTADAAAALEAWI